MTQPLTIYFVVAAVAAAVNLRGIMIMVRMGHMTFSGVRSRADWVRLGYPLFLNAVGQAAVWPLALPLLIVQTRDVMKYGLPRTHIEQHEPIDRPANEAFERQANRAYNVIGADTAARFQDDEDMHALSAAHAHMALAWLQVREEFKDQKRPSARAIDYFVSNAKHIAEGNAK